LVQNPVLAFAFGALQLCIELLVLHLQFGDLAREFIFHGVLLLADPLDLLFKLLVNTGETVPT